MWTQDDFFADAPDTYLAGLGREAPGEAPRNEAVGRSRRLTSAVRLFIADADADADDISRHAMRHGDHPAPVLSKLALPALPHPLLARPHARAAMERALGFRLTAVVAPAGWGKSTLVADWLTRAGHTSAWLALDTADNRPERFVASLLAALERALPGAFAGLLPTAKAAVSAGDGGPARHISEDLVGGILARLADAPDPTVVVLDDYHAIAADNRAVREALAFLFEGMPAQVHAVVATRADRALPAAALLRGRGHLHEVGTDDLRWRRADAAAYLVGLLGMDLHDEQVDQLADRCDGWATGFRLAGHALQQTEHRAAWIAAFDGNQRHVADYLDTECLERLAPDARDCLLRLAQFERFSAPLCDAVCGIDWGHRLLDSLVRDGGFLVALDDTGEWYRCHHLLQDLLRRRQRDTRPDLLAETWRRASRWYEAEGDIAAAAECAQRARDDEHAAGPLRLGADHPAIAPSADAQALRVSPQPDGEPRNGAAREMPNAPAGQRQRDHGPYTVALTLRESEVLQLLADGDSNKEMARELAITVGTVKRHIANVFLKLGVRSRTQAIARGRALRLFSDEPLRAAEAPPTTALAWRRMGAPQTA